MKKVKTPPWWKETTISPRSRALGVPTREHHAHHLSGERSGELLPHRRERRAQSGCGMVLPRAEKHRKAYPKLRRILEGRRIYRLVGQGVGGVRPTELSKVGRHFTISVPAAYYDIGAGNIIICYTKQLNWKFII